VSKLDAAYELAKQHAWAFIDFDEAKEGDQRLSSEFYDLPQLVRQIVVNELWTRGLVADEYGHLLLLSGRHNRRS